MHQHPPASVSCSGERQKRPRHKWEDEAGADVWDWRDATELDAIIAVAGGGPGDGGTIEGVGV